MIGKIIGHINGGYLKEMRIKHGLTPQQVADKLGVGVSTYYKWEGAKQMPSILKIQLLQILYKDLDYNKLLSLRVDKCYNNCIDNGKGKNEVR